MPARDLSEYARDLGCVICGTKAFYDSVTANVPADDKSLYWEQACNHLDKRALAPVISLLALRNLSAPEVCLLALKLLQFAAAGARMQDSPNCPEGGN